MDTSHYIQFSVPDSLDEYRDFSPLKVPEAANELFSVFDFSELQLCVTSSEPSSEPLILANSRDFIVPGPACEPPSPEVFACKECSRTFLKRRYLKDHMKIHRDERPFQCSECECAFKFKSHLNDHMRSHRNDRRFVCETCGKAFCRSTILKRHQRCHSGVRPYVCEYCLKGFTQSGNLNIHVKFHCKEKPELSL